MGGHKGNLWTRDEVFEALQRAYRRGVEFALEHVVSLPDERDEINRSVPKAAYDYADKATGPDGV